MKEKTQLYYDKEGDFLEINFGKFTKGYFEEIGDGIFKRIDGRTNKVTGIAVVGFIKRTAKIEKITLPIKFEISS